MSQDNSLYSRQKNLFLKKYDTAIVVGCGGIGNWVALDLALSGCVKDLYLIDPDTVEESNLNRTMFEYVDIGSYKVNCVARIIGRRRPQQNVYCVQAYMDDNLVDNFINKIIKDNSYYHTNIVVIDCRDDIFEDCYKFNCKLYKVGYDGMNMTINGNPRLTKVFGQRGGSYTVTPSYVGSAQLIAILAVNDILYPTAYEMCDRGDLYRDNVKDLEDKCETSESFNYTTMRPCYEYDELGRMNDCINMNCCDILSKFVTTGHHYVMPNGDFDNLPALKTEQEEANGQQQ